MKRDTRIVNGSMGSYLCPPNHPCHYYQVETDLRKKRENRGGMNLEYALTDEYTHPDTKIEIEKLLSDWEQNKPSLASDEVKKWIEDCKHNFGEYRYQKFVLKYYPDFKII